MDETKKAIPPYCVLHQGDTALPDVYLLHAFLLNKKMMPHLTNWFSKRGYTTIACDARGHGSRLFQRVDWAGTVEDYDRILLDRKRPAVLVGSSAGAMVSLNLAYRNPFVKQVFALGAPHGNDPSDHIVARLSQWNPQAHKPRVENVFPKHFLKCDPANKDKFFLIHARNDSVVPFTNFERNRDQLCLPSENTLTINNLPWWSSHLTVNNHPATFAFFEKHINDQRIDNPFKKE